jgi:hypothetical protein
LALSGNLYAKKRGAELIIIKTNGQQIRGELITVKKDSLLLLDSGIGADVSVDIDDIKVIKIMKVSEVWKEDKLSARHKIKSFSPTIAIAI